MIAKRKIIELGANLIKFTLRILSDEKQALASGIIAEAMCPIIKQDTKYGQILFFCPGTLPVWRAQTLLTKEMETIEWIDTFETNNVFWDIGANVGCYSLYAAKKGVSVLSFEPSSANYYVLCKNIELNKVSDNISPYCIAFNDSSELAYFNMSTLEIGGAISSFGQSIDEIKIVGEKKHVISRQAMIGFSVDDFIKHYKPPFPNYIKIDVDGIEDKIITGAKETIQDDRVKSILVEIDDDDSSSRDYIIRALKNCRLETISKKHSTMFDDSKYSSVYNYIFGRL
ncbi:methyltransferase FkbM domain protein [Candidatus Magnetobacterium bavaricum]|uniref:Methyltransferase FkbM domain protein n=1 Tax=Candidatus Magnetobacterium bavaricum TaxID=29290 RepID=A0A0F3GHC4_9BACT|nr:methyltransferase FkbM domain protein [Candidatus Magnetobacterium bavaricum]